VEYQLVLIFLFYGLAFFSMGLAITLEIGRGTDKRLRHALRPLAAFAIIHGLHEWFEMLDRLQIIPMDPRTELIILAARVGILAFSFLSLAAFGASLLADSDRWRRLSLLVPLGLAAVWGFGLLTLRDAYLAQIWVVADVWTRYTLAIPGAILASIGLVVLQRAFRRAGMERFGRDSLWAAVAFLWYGLVGQIFTHPTPFGPSRWLNEEVFLELFGFPVQLLRALAAIVAALFIIRVLRSFEVETQRRIAELQAARLREAQRREELRRQFLSRIVEAQEAERQRIARELHDETGQALTALGLGLRGVRSNLRRDLRRAGDQLRHLEKLVDHSLDELQRLIADLRPSHLDDLGLPAALRWYAEELGTRTDLQVEVEVAGNARPLASAVKTALFRVAQEALSNVLKHANTTRAWVRLHFGEEQVTLEVEDAGSGFDPARVAASGRTSWGLIGMEERATLLGGTFFLETGEGEGTRVVVVIPYQNKAPAAGADEVKG